MQKTVIAVMAKADRGKTTSLCKLIDILPFEGKEVDERVNTKDQLVVGTYRGVKIGINTEGDPYSGVEERMNRCIESGCQIIVSACRSKGRTTMEVDNPAKENGFQTVWIQPYFSWWGEWCGGIYLNDAFAESLKQFINQLIDDK